MSAMPSSSDSIVASGGLLFLTQIGVLHSEQWAGVVLMVVFTTCFLLGCFVCFRDTRAVEARPYDLM